MAGTDFHNPESWYVNVSKPVGALSVGEERGKEAGVTTEMATKYTKREPAVQLQLLQVR